VDTNPGSLALLNLLADVEAKSGNVDGAVARLDAVYKKTLPVDLPSAADLQIAIGDIYLGIDRFRDAAAAYERALSTRGLDHAQTLAPDEREFAMLVFDKLITTYKRANRVPDAKSVIERARKLFGRDDLFADRQLISLYQETGNRAQALTEVQTLRTRFADDISLLRTEATLLSETGQVDRGVELIKKRMAAPSEDNSSKPGLANGAATPRFDDDFSNLLFISKLYNDAGRGTEAVSAAEQASKIAGTNDRKLIAKLMIASAQQTAGKFAESEATLREIITETPRNPIALNNLGYFLLQRGERYGEALTLIEQAVKIDPNNPSYLDSLGWAYFKLDKFDEAERYLLRAAGLDFSSPTIQEHLGDVYKKQGKRDQAKNAWLRAAQLLAGTSGEARIKEKLTSLN
jgi:tetratricopeptide (TPR) repeat protein